MRASTAVSLELAIVSIFCGFGVQLSGSLIDESTLFAEGRIHVAFHCRVRSISLLTISVISFWLSRISSINLTLTKLISRCFEFYCTNLWSLTLRFLIFSFQIIFDDRLSKLFLEIINCVYMVYIDLIKIGLSLQ